MNAEQIKTWQQRLSDGIRFCPSVTEQIPAMAAEIADLRAALQSQPIGEADMRAHATEQPTGEENQVDELTTQYRLGYLAGLEIATAQQADQSAIAKSEPVATVDSLVNGSYHRKYNLTWHSDVSEGTKLYASPPAQSAGACSDKRLTDDRIADFAEQCYDSMDLVNGTDDIQVIASFIKQALQAAQAPEAQEEGKS